jgi:hypothetical protein
MSNAKPMLRASPTGFIERIWPFSDFVVTPGKPLPDSGGGACLHFSGFAQIGGKIIADADALSKDIAAGRTTISTIMAATGFFTAVLRDKDSIIFTTDLLGLEHLYRYEGDGGPAISNRLHLLTEHLRAEGVKLRPNLIYATTSLLSHHPLLRQAHGHHLQVEGIRLIPFDHYAELSNGRISVRRKPIFEKIFGRTGGKYAALIDQAVEEILQNVRAVQDSGLFDSISMDLSGGRDSRLTFGAAVRLGIVPRTPIAIRDEDGSRDLKRAMRLVDQYHGTLFTGDGHIEYGQDESSALGLWRSYYAGMYHRLSVTPFTAAGTNLRSLRLTGYCGEIYRGFWSNWFPDEVDLDGPGGMEIVFNKIARDFPEAHKPAAVAAFADVIRSLPGETVRHKLDNHYLFFRNRLHFGMRPYHSYNHYIRWPVLVSPSLLHAAHLLPEAEKAKGQATFDVLDRMAPELNFFKFDRLRWTDDMLRKSRYYKRFRGIEEKLGEVDLAPWQAAQETLKHGSAALRRGEADAFPWKRFKLHSRDISLAGAKRIQAELPELWAMLGPDFADRTAGLFALKDDDWPWRVATSKIASMVDLVLGGSRSV